MKTLLTIEEHLQLADRFLDRLFMQIACCSPYSLEHAVELFEEIVGDDEQVDGWYELTRTTLLLRLGEGGKP